MSVGRFIKDPDALLDYRLNWRPWLRGAVIAASEWEVPDGLTEESSSFDDKTTTVRLSGGIAGVEYTVTNHITTDTGLEDERSFVIVAQER